MTIFNLTIRVEKSKDCEHWTASIPQWNVRSAYGFLTADAAIRHMKAVALRCLAEKARDQDIGGVTFSVEHAL